MRGEATEDFEVALDLAPRADRLALEFGMIRILADPRSPAPGRSIAGWGDEFEGCTIDASAAGYEIAYEKSAPDCVRFLDLFPEGAAPLAVFRRRRRWFLRGG